MEQLKSKFQERKAKIKNLSTRIFNGKSLVLSQSTPYEVIAKRHQTRVRYYASANKKYLCTRQISQNPYPIRVLPS